MSASWEMPQTIKTRIFLRQLGDILQQKQLGINFDKTTFVVIAGNNTYETEVSLRKEGKEKLHWSYCFHSFSLDHTSSPNLMDAFVSSSYSTSQKHSTHLLAHNLLETFFLDSCDTTWSKFFSYLSIYFVLLPPHPPFFQMHFSNTILSAELHIFTANCLSSISTWIAHNIANLIFSFPS